MTEIKPMDKRFNRAYPPCVFSGLLECSSVPQKASVIIPDEGLMLARILLNPSGSLSPPSHFSPASTLDGCSLREGGFTCHNGWYLHAVPGRKCSGSSLMAGQHREWPQSRVRQKFSFAFTCIYLGKCKQYHFLMPSFDNDVPITLLNFSFLLTTHLYKLALTTAIWLCDAKLHKSEVILIRKYTAV